MIVIPPEVQRELAAAEAAQMSGEIVLHLKAGRIESYEVRRRGRIKVTTTPPPPEMPSRIATAEDVLH